MSGRLKQLSVIFIVLQLTACSYAFDIKAVKLGSDIWFDVAESSARSPDCLKSIEIRKSATNEVVWSVGSPHHDCVLELPIKYGADFAELGSKAIRAPSLLEEDTSYAVSALAEGSGYSEGIFSFQKSAATK